MTKSSAIESKPLTWLGSTKKDLLALPGQVIDTFGYALHLAQIGKKHPQAIAGFRIGRCFGGGRKLAKQHLSCHLYGAVCSNGLRFTRISEEVQERQRDAQARYGHDQGSIK